MWECKHPAEPAAGEPFCTHSQMIAYRDAQGKEVARAHQYKRPDGTLGLSGKPDPKRMYAGGVVYKFRKGPKP